MNEKECLFYAFAFVENRTSTKISTNTKLNVKMQAADTQNNGQIS